MSEVLSALSFALDLTEGQPMGHALRSCLIGMEIAARLDLPMMQRRDLYYGLLLKDVGCSSNAARVFALFGGDERAAKQHRMTVDWTNYFRAARYSLAHVAPGASWFERAQRVARLATAGPRVAAELVETRCVRGAEIVTQLGLGTPIAEAVRALDEHWDGHGHPYGLRGEEIPLLARIMSLAQTIEVFAQRTNASRALRITHDRAGRWFDPVLVSACRDLEAPLVEWCALDSTALRERVRESEPGGAALLAGPGTLDRIAIAFAEVVDAKSPFTGQHSYRMTEMVMRIARRLGHDAPELAELRRAALLHDIGKLSLPNSILDKPGRLTPAEWDIVRMHSYYTERILEHIRGFEDLAFVAASHHERLDGTGYCRGLRGEQIPDLSKALAVADVWDALSSARPYRPALPTEQVIEMMERDREIGLDPECLDALEHEIGDAGADPAREGDSEPGASARAA